MSVFRKEKGGAWFVRYRDIEGKQRERKAGATKALAQELERKILAERDLQKRFGYTKKKEITFSDWTKEYLERIKSRTKENTIEARYYYTKKMCENFGNKFLSELTESDFWEYVKTTKGGIGGKTVRNYAVLFLGMLSEAKDCGYDIAVIKLKFSKKVSSRVRYLSEDEAVRLLDNCKREKMKLLIKMALNTGMRKMEMLNLTWQNIDLKAKLIHIEESKNGERRSIPINQSLLLELKKIPEKESGEKIFADLKNVDEYFRKIVKESNIKDFHFHDLRHTFASWLAIKGISLNTIKELLGHKSITMTQRYAHLSPDSRQNAVEQIHI